MLTSDSSQDLLYWVYRN